MEPKRKYFGKRFGVVVFYTMTVNGVQCCSSKYLCVQQKKKACLERHGE